ELTVREARRLARRLFDDSSFNAAIYVAAVFESVLSRTPTIDEVEMCLGFLRQQTSRFGAEPERFGATTADAADLSRPSANPAMRARENLVHVLLNHHEFVSIR
ncbi:MAG TPA: hypothetical protein VJ809_12985, partial [Pirellulales bacterium]|nr:hypothetical protein [Pirellulales bacterium]